MIGRYVYSDASTRNLQGIFKCLIYPYTAQDCGSSHAKNQTSVNLCLGAGSQKPAVRKIAMIGQLHVFADSSWCLFLVKLAKLLLLSRERATLLLSINLYFI